MSISIHTRTDRETRLANELRTIAVHAIDNRSTPDVIDALGLAPSGLDRLLAEKHWGLQVAFRVADCLGIEVVESMLNATKTNGHAQNGH